MLPPSKEPLVFLGHTPLGAVDIPLFLKIHGHSPSGRDSKVCLVFLVNHSQSRIPLRSTIDADAVKGVYCGLVIRFAHVVNAAK